MSQSWHKRPHKRSGHLFEQIPLHTVAIVNRQHASGCWWTGHFSYLRLGLSLAVVILTLIGYMAYQCVTPTTLFNLLVAGFTIYGSAGLQIASRTYMDLLHQDAEHNFLRLMPAIMIKSLLIHS